MVFKTSFRGYGRVVGEASASVAVKSTNSLLPVASAKETEVLKK